MSDIVKAQTINYATQEAGIAMSRGQTVVAVDFHVLIPADSLSLYTQQPDAAEDVGAMLASLLAQYAPQILEDLRLTAADWGGSADA